MPLTGMGDMGLMDKWRSYNRISLMACSKKAAYPLGNLKVPRSPRWAEEYACA